MRRISLVGVCLGAAGFLVMVSAGTSKEEGVGAPRLISWGDFDADGSEDALVVTRTGALRVLRNLGPDGFEDATRPLGLEGTLARGASWIDFDRDGWLDVFLIRQDGRGGLLRNLGDALGFQSTDADLQLASIGIVESAEWVDLDHDGRLDLVASGTFGVRVMRNLGEQGFRPFLVSEEGLNRGLGVLASRGSAEAKSAGSSDALEGQPRTAPLVHRGARDRSSRPTLHSSGEPLSVAGGETRTEVVAAGGKAVCAGGVEDASGAAGCLRASSVPALGKLYPLSQDLFVDPETGYVGVGTTSPTERFEVAGGGLRVLANDSKFTLDNLGEGSSHSQLEDTPTALRLEKVRPSGETAISVSPAPADNASDAVVRFFRNTTTMGNKAVEFHRGNGADNVHAKIGVAGGDTFFSIGGGNLGIGTPSPQAPLHVYEASARLRLEDSDSADHSVLVDDDGSSLRVERHSSSGEAFVDLDPDAEDGISTSALRVFRRTNTSGMKSLQLMKGDDTATVDVQLGVDGADSYFTGGGNVGIGTSNPQQALDVAGTTRTEILTIKGGSDVVERFPSAGEDCTPGQVVVIDPERIGHVRVGSQPYDRRVAGVVSGAGGVRPGLELYQEGFLEGDVLVALSGRVYVQASAENGAIRAGDRLTTSSTPGHAMRVSEGAPCDGAVIGKAMSGLESDTGLVLVLVNLQ